MIAISQLTELLGWASAINIGFLIFATILLVTLRSSIASMHSKLFGIPEDELSNLYFNYLANYKTLSLVLVVVPYLSLKLMGN